METIFICPDCNSALLELKDRCGNIKYLWCKILCGTTWIFPNEGLIDATVSRFTDDRLLIKMKMEKLTREKI